MNPPRNIIPEKYAEAVKRTDHTLLGHVTPEQVQELCRQALVSDPRPNSLCVQGQDMIRITRERVDEAGADGELLVCGVGERQFPYDMLSPAPGGTPENIQLDQLPGVLPLADKLKDVQEIMPFADLFDMVLNVRHVLENRLQEGVLEVKQVFREVQRIKPHAELRVICSTALLRMLQGEEGIRKACLVMEMAAGEDIGGLVMKTETGFVADGRDGKFGAHVRDVRLMRQLLPVRVKIKASGGITRDNVLEFLEAGADYIGSSSLLQTFLS